MAPEKGFAVPSPRLTPAPPEYTFGQLWQVPLFLLGLAAVLTVWATRPLWHHPEAIRLRRDLAQARSQLQDPHAALNGLTVTLNAALSHIDHLPERVGETHFLLGTTYLRLAEQVPAERADDLRRKARSHLEQAERFGVPETDRPELCYRLAKAWYHTGGDVQRIIDYLSKSIDQIESDRAAGYEMLTQCYLRLPTPNLSAALEANAKQLQLPTTDESRLLPARLLRGELLLRLQQRDAARKVLARIGPDAPPPILARARLLRAHSYQEEGAWEEAAKLWKELLADRRQPPPNPGRIWWFLGLCYHHLHLLPDAARAWEQAILLQGEEGQAAGLRLANVRIATGDIPAGLKCYESALGNVQKPADYQNKLVDPRQARDLLASDGRVCKDAGNFEAAEKLALLHAKLAPRGAAQALLGQVAEAWAAAQQAQAEQLKDAASYRPLLDAARTNFRKAAAAYDAAAEAAAGLPEQSDWLWRAGTCYMQAQDFPRAIGVYLNFINSRPPAARLSEAWYRLGEAHQALHDDQSAASCYRRSIQTNGPFTCRALYQLAMAEKDRAHLKEAEEMLEQLLRLLERASADTDPETHAKALYALGEISFLRRDFLITAHRLERALALYPASRAAATARYQLAVSWRSLAHLEAERIRLSGPPDTRPRFRGQFFLALETASAHLQKLVEDLPAADATLLRQARFALADCRFDQRLYALAIPLYIGLAADYEQGVEGLVALQQLYRCYVTSMAPEKPEENLGLAFDTLERFRKNLKQLDDGAFQGRPETQKRTAWERWLKDEEEQLQQLRLVKPQSSRSTISALRATG